MKTGTADLPLHGGRVPMWLASRMARLGRVMVEALVIEYGRTEVLRRLADPFWFQALGCVMGMDWHSSGITTSVLGALKRGLAPVEAELGIHVCGGRGRHSRRTPEELLALGERVGRTATPSRCHWPSTTKPCASSGGPWIARRWVRPTSSRRCADWTISVGLPKPWPKEEACPRAPPPCSPRSWPTRRPLRLCSTAELAPAAREGHASFLQGGHRGTMHAGRRIRPDQAASRHHHRGRWGADGDLAKYWSSSPDDARWLR